MYVRMKERISYLTLIVVCLFRLWPLSKALVLLTVLYPYALCDAENYKPANPLGLFICFLLLFLGFPWCFWSRWLQGLSG